MNAEEFTLQDANKKEVSLEDFLGKWVVLYFYPKDLTSGCTIEAIQFTKKKKEFEKLNAVIIGISPDSCELHQKFSEKEKLNLILLSDTEKEVIKKYNVWKEKNMYGRKYFGVDRSTFLIDPQGRIAKEWRSVKVPGHVDNVLKELKSLSS